MKSSALKRICRYAIDPNPIYGLVLAESDELLLIARVYDFFIDGFQVIRKRDIDEIGSSDSCKYTYKLLSREGLLKGIEAPVESLLGWHAVFSELGKGEFVLIEDEVSDDMMIGPITKIDSKAVSLRYFDGTGKWRDECDIEYNDVTSLQIRTNYIRVHRKYIGAV